MAEPEKYSSLKIRLRREGGAAVYVNGVEVVRDKLAPDAAFDTTSEAGRHLDSYAGFVFIVDPEVLRKGRNIIAVEVHEAYVKMAGHLEGRDWKNRAHFFGAAAEAMRRILINYARSRNSLKRGSGQRPEAINVLELAGGQDPEMILVVDEAIQELKEQDPGLGELGHLRFFAGLSIAQTAEVMEMSPRSVARHWNFARAWLTRTIKEMLHRD